jgi:hypothetical protein
VDALGVDHIETMPLTPERVWQTLQAATARK